MRSGLGMRHVFSSSFQAPPETEPEEEELQMTNAEQVAQEVTEDGSAHHKGDLSVYLFFFETGPAWQFLLFLVAVTLHTICERVSAIFMRIWLDSFPDSRSMFATYAVLGFSPILTFFAMNILYFQFLVPNFAATMHQMLVDSILGATLPYLTSTDNGIIINRISQHMTLITQQFARDFFQLPYAGTSVIVDVIIIASTSLYAIVLAPIVCLVLYLVQLVYLRTSRQLRLLDLESKTPLYSYLAEVGSGIEHIRAFGWEEEYRRRAFALVDATQRPYYLLLCLGRWLNLVMDGNTAVLAVILMAFANYWDQVTSKNGVGLAFVTLISLGETTTFFMNQWVAIETSLGAITSIRSFVKNTPSEPRNQDTKKMPQSWPTRGAIEFKGVTAEYEFVAFEVVSKIYPALCCAMYPSPYQAVIKLELSAEQEGKSLQYYNTSLNTSAKTFTLLIAENRLYMQRFLIA
ncbi:hypothetical protein Golomagni_06149 [Golovinomyces magnicellulatus]|nr:hypothetical protein Golomagni_06149 [Golovinomyces magnicellulatus]